MAKRQIILDTETTGLSPQNGDRIVEIGCVEIVNRRLTGNNYHQYINPQRKVDAGAVRVHGITNDFLADKPFFADVVDSFLEYIADAELIAHNAPFDMGFIRHELGLVRKKGRFSPSAVIDTLEMSRKMYPGQKHNLDAVCRRCKIDLTKRTLHGALLDATLLAEAYLRMTAGQATLLEAYGADADSDEGGEGGNGVAAAGCYIETDEITAAKKSGSPRAAAKATKQRKRLPLVRASEAEVALHQEFLQTIKKRGGKCIWEEDE